MKKILLAIVVAVGIAFVMAGAGTHIAYACPPVDGARGCVEFSKAIMHPGDLLHNKEDSLVHFATTFFLTFLVVFAVITIAFQILNKQRNNESST